MTGHWHRGLRRPGDEVGLHEWRAEGDDSTDAAERLANGRARAGQVRRATWEPVGSPEGQNERAWPGGGGTATASERHLQQ